MNKAKVSIIIPVYNMEKHLEQCIDSLTNQTLDDIEIICIDDCSTDNSLNLLKNLSKKDNRIKYLALPKNSGAGPARNEGMALASGQYISFVDSDDFISDNAAYEKLYEYGAENNADIVSANLKLYYNDDYHESPFITRIKEKGPMPSQEYGIPWYYQKNLFKRQFLIDNEISFPDYRSGEDPLFFVKALTHVDHIYCLPFDFYTYRAPLHHKIDTEKKEIGHINHFKDVYDILNNPRFDKMRLKYDEMMYQFFIDQKFHFGSETLEKNIKKIFGVNSKVFMIYELKCSLFEKDNAIKTLNCTLSDKNRTIQKLKSSNSWKITAPIRKLGNILRRLKNS